MVGYRYSFTKMEENMARAVGTDLDLSTKKAIEICNFLRFKKLDKAIKILEGVIAEKEFIPFKRFTEGAGHQRGIGAAKKPVSASKQIIKILKSVESNARDKSLAKDLKIIHLSAQKASQPYHYGRKRRIKMKRTHIEIVVQEAKKKKVQAPVEAKKESKSETKVETKPKESLIESKPEVKVETKEKQLTPENIASATIASEEKVTEVKE
jgi:large subunit ribosomal protein L22